MLTKRQAYISFSSQPNLRPPIPPPHQLVPIAHSSSLLQEEIQPRNNSSHSSSVGIVLRSLVPTPKSTFAAPSHSRERTIASAMPHRPVSPSCSPDPMAVKTALALYGRDGRRYHEAHFCIQIGCDVVASSRRTHLNPGPGRTSPLVSLTPLTLQSNSSCQVMMSRFVMA